MLRRLHCTTCFSREEKIRFDLDDGNQKTVQTNIPANNQKEDTNCLIAMAAEQFAILLWKTWLHKKSAKGKQNKKRNPH